MNIYNKFYIFLYYSNRNNTLEKHYLKKKKDIDCIQFFKIKIIDILTRKIVRNFNGDRRKFRNKMEFNFEQQKLSMFFRIEKREEDKIARL